ncbi:hypothetical protein [Rickettsiella endosymbiont of Xylota segnis]|uniref:hypothetical protein n=1 Tax=Rickettsiella endosymbiont of Xylota segnis TaxID=3066238 RepID=UPI0030CA7ED5
MHKEMQFQFIFLSIFVFFIFFTSSIEAREPLPSRFSAAAYTGVYTVGQADLMVSLDGDEQHNLYVNPQGAYGSDQQWYGDVGLGYRWIKNDAAILGWYLFAGHSRVENSSGFWITNPGLEVMGSRWDARINAYIPVAGRSNELGIKDFNIVSTPVFTGHTETINSVFNEVNGIQQIGNGADARVGYQFFYQVPLKGYIGAYFFDIANTDNVRGGAAGLEYWFDDNIRVFANYSYDNYQHSKVVGGLGISFGGVRKHWADPSLSERLTDPIERYLANLGHGSGIPSKTLLYAMGRGSSSEVISNNIAFFSQTGTPNTGGNLTIANCTFENPCGPNDFTQTGVDSLNTILLNTMFYFNGGTYPANNIGNALTLNVGQSVFSRTGDYSAAATGAARSTFNGGFILNGNNTLDSVILNNTLVAPTNGISSTGGQNIMINNSQIGSAGNPYTTGVNLLNVSNASITGDTIEASLIGLNVLNSTSINVDNTVINANGANAAGVVGAGSQINLNNGVITVTSNAASSSAGISSLSNATVTGDGMQITVTNNGTGPALDLFTFSSGSIVVVNNQLVANGTNAAIASGANIVVGLTNTCTLNGVAVPCP